MAGEEAHFRTEEGKDETNNIPTAQLYLVLLIKINISSARTVVADYVGEVTDG